jgi:DNA-binding CsgD family transcriptional regulator/PAS domain-containing protein
LPEELRASGSAPGGVGVSDSIEPDWRLIAELIPEVVWIAGADGSTNYFNRHILRRSPIRDSGDAVVKWIGTATDIEDRKRLEAGLVEARSASVAAAAFLEILGAAAPIGFAFLDHDLRLVRVNEEFAALSQTPVDEQVGLRVAEVFPDLWRQLDATFQRVFETGDTIRVLAMLAVPARDPGRSHEWLASCGPVYVKGEITGIGVVIIDVTEWGMAEHRGHGARNLEWDSRRGPTAVLTNRERQVLDCIAEGMTNKVIADRLNITANTVRNHVQRILYKLNVHSKLEAVVVGQQTQMH